MASAALSQNDWRRRLLRSSLVGLWRVLCDFAGPEFQAGHGAFLGRRASGAHVLFAIHEHGVEETAVRFLAADGLDV
jgi:hypothetical protein